MNEDKPLISYIIITMNRRDVLRQALESVMAQGWSNREIIVVDNASSDGTAEMVKQAFPDVRLLRQSRNLGVAGGRNLAMREAKGEYLISIDDDMTLENTPFGEQIHTYFSVDPSLACISFHLLDAQTKQSDSRMVPRRDKTVPTQDVATGYFLGGACAIRRAALNAVGDYWEQLNPYGAEEFDLSYRLLEAGYTMRWVKGITAIHHESALARPSGRKAYALARNYPLVALRHLPVMYALSYIVLWWGYALKEAIKDKAVAAWLKGVAASLVAMPVALQKRRVISPATIQRLQLTNGPLWY